VEAGFEESEVLSQPVVIKVAAAMASIEPVRLRFFIGFIPQLEVIVVIEKYSKLYEFIIHRGLIETHPLVGQKC